jgi:hypothetical protein
MVCKEPTKYRAVVEAPKEGAGFLSVLRALNIQVRKPVCPECIDDAAKMTRLLGRAVKTIKTGTRALGKEPGDE